MRPMWRYAPHPDVMRRMANCSSERRGPQRTPKNDDGSVTIQFGGCDGPGAELPADHARLELHRSHVSTSRGDPRRHLEVSGGGTREVMQ